MEELGDHSGPPATDAELETLTFRHMDRHPSSPNSGQLVSIPDDVWNDSDKRKAVLEQVELGAAGTGDSPLGKKNYELRDTFKDDAMTCWVQEHNRTRNCGDYRTDKKKLVPGTADERRRLGLPKYNQPPQRTRYLCDYCPFHQLVIQVQRERAGMYE